MRLNPWQDKAVTYIDGPLLVLAGAGSGKTRVITQKIVHLVETCGYAASKLVAVTFTNKAAREMKERVGQVLSKPLRRGLTVSTFHQLGLNIIRSDLTRFGLRQGFSIFDSSDSISLIQKLLPEHLARDKDNINEFVSIISSWKNDALLPKDLLPRVDLNAKEQQALSLYQSYHQSLNAYNAVDFDDLILLPLLALKEHADFRERWQNRIRYLLVDEYQDTNTCQYDLVKTLVGPRGALTVVGDDSQSIYTWRGARPENLRDLKKDFPNLEVIMLEQNYRSSGCILQASNHLIANNQQLYEKKLWSELGFGERVRIVHCDDEFQEVEQVASEIMAHKVTHSNKYSDYAILYRGNHQSKLFEKALQLKGIPYRVSGGESLFSRTEIKDIFAYLKLFCNPSDDNAFLRVINTPRRGIGMATIEGLAEVAKQTESSLFEACSSMALLESMKEKGREKLDTFENWYQQTVKSVAETKDMNKTLKQFIEDIDYQGYLYQSISDPKRVERKMAMVYDFIDWVDNLMHRDKDNPLSLSEVIAKLSLIDVMDRGEEEAAEDVQLLTLHAAKGLEYPHVYLVGMEEEILPHKTSIEEDNIEEERRLLYVGMTRAQQTLTLTLARTRKRFGETLETKPSRFLDELPKELIEVEGEKQNTITQSKGKAHLAGLKSLLS